MLAALIFAAVMAAPQSFEDDVAFALDALEQKCGHFFALKEIDWKEVRKEIGKQAKSAKSEGDEFVVLARLIARLKDGHAEVRPGENGGELKWPDDAPFGGSRGSAGMAWCRIGKKIYVKSVDGSARDAGVEPGSEVLKADGMPVEKWISARVQEGRDVLALGAEQHAFFWATHLGLSGKEGSRLTMDVKTPDGKKKARTITFGRSNYRSYGPAAFPEGMRGEKDLTWTKLESGVGYLHLRRCKDDLPEQLDAALADLGTISGLVLDFRGNSGGGFDHEAFMGRFVAPGTELAFSKRYASAGAQPFAGPVVVIVDASVVSAGETGSGMFKEDGRALMIGESATAGMSSSKETIGLPSGRYALYVSVASNMGRANGGRGLEGIGAVPHLLVEFDPADLAAGRDTLILRAEDLLAEAADRTGLWKEVPYRIPE